MNATSDRSADELATSTELVSKQPDADYQRVFPRRLRSVLSGILIVLALVISPVAITASWAKNELASTDVFVAQLAPLANDPAVQAMLTDEAVAAIESSVDLDAIASDLFDGLKTLDLPPRSAAALALLEAPAVAGARSVIRSTVQEAVQSDAFAGLWENTLRLSHEQVTGALAGDPDTALSLSASGEIGINLGPLVASVRQQLIDNGMTFATAIPEVDRIVPLGQSDAMTSARFGYNLILQLGLWLPVFCLVAFAGGILLARRRARAAIWTGISLSVISALLAVGVAAGKLAALSAVTPDPLPRDAADAIIQAATVGLAQPIKLMITIGIVTAIVAYLAGPFRGAVALRSGTSSLFTRVRGAAERSGITTGVFGRVLHRLRVLTRVLVVIIALVILIMSRPLSGATIVLVVLSAAVLLLILELLSRPESSAPVKGPGVPTASEPTT